MIIIMNNIKNILKIGVILILIISLQSCGSSRKIIDSTDPNPVLTETETETESATETIVIDDPVADGRVAPKKSFFDNLKANLDDNENFTPMQKSLIKNATNMVEEKAYFLLLEEDGIEVDIVMSGDITRIMMSVEDIEKINNKYRMAEILEELVQKYNIENELNLTIVESLTNEVILLNEKVLLLNDELKNKDQIISTLEGVITELKESNSILTDVNVKQADVIKLKDKEIRRQKRQKTFIAIGSGVVITLLLLLAF
tara:strand:- start:48634 stop:49407 length:774 start_codon:yes stop_codon:yes gene_type:complete